MSRLLVVLLLLLLLGLHYRLWIADGGYAEIAHLKREISAHQQQNAQLKSRNAALEAEVNDLKQGLDAMEERARADLGMVKEDEEFFLMVEPVPTP
ncbi:MAG: cell division protein FtsB [Nevskiales bacterium]